MTAPADVRALAAGMAGLGVTSGATVALLTPDRSESELVIAAAQLLGATVTDELPTSRAQVAICEPQHLETVLAARKGTAVQHVVCLGGGDPRALTLAELRDAAPAGLEFSEDSTVKAQVSYREWEADLIVRHREEAADGVLALTLADPEGRELPAWTPGAHIDLLLAPGLVRQYSLCGSARDRSSWRIGVLLDAGGRGGSRHVHEELRQGVTVRVRGPRNHFPLVDVPSYQFIAGGIGVTPILTMIEAAEARGADWRLLYGGRHTDSMAFLAELGAYGDRVTIWPQDSHGMLDLAAVLGTPREDTLVYCCGPEALLGAVENACAVWPQGSLHIERFAAKAGSDEPAADALDSFEVVCQRSGITVEVGPQDTIFDAVSDAGVDVLASCMEGVCGTCECAVLEGAPDHRDSMLTDAERDAGQVMMICVSRSRSERLVLDI